MRTDCLWFLDVDGLVACYPLFFRKILPGKILNSIGAIYMAEESHLLVYSASCKIDLELEINKNVVTLTHYARDGWWEGKLERGGRATQPTRTTAKHEINRFIMLEKKQLKQAVAFVAFSNLFWNPSHR